MTPRRSASFAAVIASTVAIAAPAFAGQGLSMDLKDTGQREYYCTATFEMTLPSEAPYQDVNGYFYVFVDDEQVGRSKGSSFRFLDGATTASATFETPNAPCGDVNGYVFVVGACMQGNGFADRSECAASIMPSGPVREIKAR